MTQAAFDAAVALALESAACFRRMSPDMVLHAESADEYLLFLELGFQPSETAGGLVFRAPVEALEQLAERAKSEPAARSLLRQHLIRRLKAGVPLAMIESKAAAAFLDDRFPSLPARPGPKQANHFERDFHIFVLARHIEETFGLSLTRNDASKVQRSACDAISVAYRQVGLHEVTYAAVKAIIFRPDLQKRIDEYVALKAATKAG